MACILSLGRLASQQSPVASFRRTASPDGLPAHLVWLCWVEVALLRFFLGMLQACLVSGLKCLRAVKNTSHKVTVIVLQEELTFVACLLATRAERGSDTPSLSVFTVTTERVITLVLVVISILKGYVISQRSRATKWDNLVFPNTM